MSLFSCLGNHVPFFSTVHVNGARCGAYMSALLKAHKFDSKASQCFCGLVCYFTTRAQHKPLCGRSRYVLPSNTIHCIKNTKKPRKIARLQSHCHTQKHRSIEQLFKRPLFARLVGVTIYRGGVLRSIAIGCYGLLEGCCGLLRHR